MIEAFITFNVDCYDVKKCSWEYLVVW